MNENAPANSGTVTPYREDRRTKSCLVVDDASVIRRVVSAMLREMNYEVAEAPTGLHAIDYCLVNNPDFILLDWNMPLMDGLSCLRRLRAMPFKKKPAIVMCTTENQTNKIQQALEAGADEYIMKPFDRDVLLDKLVQLDLV